MREIKFRAWNKDKKTMMIPNGELNINGNEGYGSLEQYIFAKDKKDDCYYNVDGEVILMQFTGLLDKNKKEIYEGDIIKFKNAVMTDKWHYGQVSYEPFSFRLSPNTYNNKHDFGAVLAETGWEIVGNCFEDPELLNKEPHE